MRELMNSGLRHTQGSGERSDGFGFSSTTIASLHLVGAFRYPFQIARIRQYMLNAWQRIRDNDWRAWLAPGFWNHRGCDYVNENPCTNDAKLTRAHRNGYLNRGNHHKLREIEAAQDAGFKALDEQLDSLKSGLAKAVTDPVDKARNEQVQVTAREVAEQLEGDARITAIGDEEEDSGASGPKHSRKTPQSAPWRPLHRLVWLLSRWTSPVRSGDSTGYTSPGSKSPPACSPSASHWAPEPATAPHRSATLRCTERQDLVTR
jgi:hypothetical protein